MMAYRSASVFVFLFLSLACAQAYSSSFLGGHDEALPLGNGNEAKFSSNSIFPENILKVFGAGAGDSGSFFDSPKLIDFRQGDSKKDNKAVESPSPMPNIIGDMSSTTTVAPESTTTSQPSSFATGNSGENIGSSTATAAILNFIDLTNIPTFSSLTNNLQKVNFTIPSLSGNFIKPPSSETNGFSETLESLSKLPKAVSSVADIVTNLTTNSAVSINEATTTFINATKNLNNTKEGYESLLASGKTLNNTLIEFSDDVLIYSNNAAEAISDEGIKIVQQFVYDAQQAITILTNPVKKALGNLIRYDLINGVGSKNSSLAAIFDQLSGANKNTKKNVAKKPMGNDAIRVVDMTENVIKSLTNFSNALFGIYAGMEIIKKGPNGKEESLAGMFLGPKPTDTKTGKDDGNTVMEGIVIKNSVGIGNLNIPSLVSSFASNAFGLQNTMFNEDCMKELKLQRIEDTSNSKSKKSVIESVTDGFTSGLNTLGLSNLLCNNATNYIQGLMKDGRNLIARLNFLERVADLDENEKNNVHSLGDHVQNIIDNIAKGVATPNTFQGDLSSLGDSLVEFSNSSLQYLAAKPMEEIKAFGNLMKQFGLVEVLGLENIGNVAMNITERIGGLNGIAELGGNIVKSAQDTVSGAVNNTKNIINGVTKTASGNSLPFFGVNVNNSQQPKMF